MEAEQRTQFSTRIYQLTEQYRVGSPISLYGMQPEWIRSCQVLRRVLLGAVICAMLFVLLVVALFLYQYFIVFTGQMPDVRERLMLSLPGTIVGLLGGGACMFIREIIGQKVPTSFLVCAKGLLELRPKVVGVTYWNDVRGIWQISELRKKKLYKLERINQKPLLFSEALEDIDGLAGMVRQQIGKGN